MIREIVFWLQAIRTGYATFAVAARWADATLSSQDVIPYWLSDLAFARSEQDAITALHAGLRHIERDQDPAGLHLKAEDIDWTALDFGFRYLRYERKDFGLTKLLTETGEEADGVNYSNPPCEAFFSLLGDLERAATPANREKVELNVRALFEPFTTLVRDEYSRICKAA